MTDPAELTTWQQAMKEVVAELHGHVGVAKALGYDDRRNVWPWTSLSRPLPADKAPALEKATGGKVTVERLCPSAPWFRLPDSAWPHPQGRPCLDVTRAATPAEQQKADA